MRKLEKWNFKSRQYEEFESPASNVRLTSDDMELVIDCTNCAKQVTFGSSYTSRTIHNRFGLGYPVCEECYNEELKQDRLSRELLA